MLLPWYKDLRFSVLLAVLLTFTCIMVFYVRFPMIYSWDLFGSYIYLPQVFEQKSLVLNDLSYPEALNQKYHLSSTLYQFVESGNGHFMTKYTSGWAVLMLPFYLIAEFVAQLAGYPADGFSVPYQVLIILGNLFYLAWSIISLRRVLLFFFSQKDTFWILLICLFGTNFLFMQYGGLGSTHLSIFFLLTQLLLFTIKYHHQQRASYALGIGLSVGLLFLVRPPDILFALLPLFWKMGDFSFKEKVRFLIRERRTQVLLIVGSAFLTMSVQLCFWKLNAGTWLMDSYSNNAGEGFDLLSPHTLPFLFSFRKGWLLYTPVAIFMLWGLYYWLKKEQNGRLIFFLFFLFLYVVSSWTTWWYAASFSQRAMIDIYPILAIALGFFLESGLFVRFRKGFILLLVVLISLNLFQTYQIDRGILHTDRMTKDYYFSIFGQTSPPTPEQYQLLSFDRESMYVPEVKITDDFYLSKVKTIDINESLTESNYASYKEFLPKQLSSAPYFWVISEWEIDSLSSMKKALFFSNMAYKGKTYAWMGKNLQESADSLRQNKVRLAYFTPHFRSDNDVMRFCFLYEKGTPIHIKRLKLFVYSPKKIRD